MIDHIFNILSVEMIVGSLIATMIMIFLGFKYPDICFLLGLPALVFLGQLKNYFPVSVSAGASLFPLVGVVTCVLRGRRFSWGDSEKLIVCLALLMVMSISYSPYPAYGRDKAILFCFMVLPIVVFAPIVVSNLISLGKGVAIITITFVIYAVWSGLLFKGQGVLEGRMAFLGEATCAGQYLGLASIVCFMHIVLGTRGFFSKFFFAFTMCISLFLLFVSGTRAAVLGVVLTLLFVYWFVYIDWFKRIFSKLNRTYAILFLAVLFMISGKYILNSYIPNDVYNRFASLEGFFSNFTSKEIVNWEDSKGRTVNYFSAIEGFISNPLMGVGAGGYGSVLNNYHKIKLYYSGIDIVHSYPHNLILEFAVEQGFLGLLLIIYLLYLNFRMILALRSFIRVNDTHLFVVTFCVSIYVYGLLVAMTALDVPRMMILWWGMGLMLATSKACNQIKS